jgi:LPS export ABC transporter protein LptC
MQKPLWRRIRFIRWSIYLAMICLMVVLLGGIELRKGARPREPGQSSTGLDREARVVINNLDYSEVREGRTRWTLRAGKAHYYEVRQETVLSLVSAVFFLEDGGRVELRGDEGVLDNASKNIEIRGKVRLNYGNDYWLVTDRLSYDNEKELIHTSEPVILEGRGLILKGVGMNLEVASHILKILKHVETNLQGFSLSAA